MFNVLQALTSYDHYLPKMKEETVLMHSILQGLQNII